MTLFNKNNNDYLIFFIVNFISVKCLTFATRTFSLVRIDLGLQEAGVQDHCFIVYYGLLIVCWLIWQKKGITPHS